MCLKLEYEKHFVVSTTVRKISEVLFSQSTVATYVRCGRKWRIMSLANFILFITVEIFFSQIGQHLTAEFPAVQFYYRDAVYIF